VPFGPEPYRKFTGIVQIPEEDKTPLPLPDGEAAKRFGEILAPTWPLTR
jgi:hypothetical protein